MANREIETPVGKHKVLLKEFITGRDKQAIDAVFLVGGSLADENASVQDKLEEVSMRGENKAFEQIIVSIDGESEGVVEKVLDMHINDYEVVKEAINQITEPLSSEKKSE